MEQFNSDHHEEKMAEASRKVEKLVEEIRQKYPDIRFTLEDRPNEFVVEVEGSGKIAHITKVDPFVLIEGGVPREVPLHMAVRAAILAPEQTNTAMALESSAKRYPEVAENKETGQN